MTAGIKPDSVFSVNTEFLSLQPPGYCEIPIFDLLSLEVPCTEN